MISSLSRFRKRAGGLIWRAGAVPVSRMGFGLFVMALLVFPGTGKADQIMTISKDQISIGKEQSAERGEDIVLNTPPRNTNSTSGQGWGSPEYPMLPPEVQIYVPWYGNANAYPGSGQRPPGQGWHPGRPGQRPPDQGYKPGRPGRPGQRPSGNWEQPGKPARRPPGQENRPATGQRPPQQWGQPPQSGQRPSQEWNRPDNFRPEQRPGTPFRPASGQNPSFGGSGKGASQGVPVRALPPGNGGAGVTRP